MRRVAGGLVVAALAAVPGGVSAQSGTVSATATILGTLTVTNDGDLDFGAIVPGSGVVVAPGGAPATGTLGHLRVDHTSNFTVTSAVPTQLTGPAVIDVSFQCGYSAAQNGALSGGSFDCSAPASSPATALGAATVTYLQVGGSILGGDTSGKPAGIYTGSLTFTFTPTI